MFITLTDIVNNTQVRLNTSHIVKYGKHKDINNEDEVTSIILNHDEAVFVKQSPEQLDALLGECFITVKGEPK